MILAKKNILRPAQIFDAEIEVLKGAKKTLKTRQRVRVHIGTIEAMARVQVLNEENEIKQGEKDFAQIRLEIAVAAVPNERFILRSYSPQITIAGGKILDNSAVKHRRKDFETTRKFLNDLVKSEDNKTTQIKLHLETDGERGANFADLQARTAWREPILSKALAENIEKTSVIKADDFFIARTPFDNLKSKTLTKIEDFHQREPLAKGILRETLRENLFAHLAPEIFKSVLTNLENEKKIASEKDIVRIASHSLELSPEEKLLREKILRIYAAANLEVSKLDDVLRDSVKNTKSDLSHARKIFQLLVNSGEIIKITEEFYFEKSAIENLLKKLKYFAAASSDKLIDVANFKEIAGISRKYAIPLLEYFDREKITRRAGDKRLIL